MPSKVTQAMLCGSRCLQSAPAVELAKNNHQIAFEAQSKQTSISSSSTSVVGKPPSLSRKGMNKMDVYARSFKANAEKAANSNNLPPSLDKAIACPSPMIYSLMKSLNDDNERHQELIRAG